MSGDSRISGRCARDGRAVRAATPRRRIDVDVCTSGSARAATSAVRCALKFERVRGGTLSDPIMVAILRRFKAIEPAKMSVFTRIAMMSGVCRDMHQCTLDERPHAYLRFACIVGALSEPRDHRKIFTRSSPARELSAAERGCQRDADEGAARDESGHGGRCTLLLSAPRLLLLLRLEHVPLE